MVTFSNHCNNILKSPRDQKIYFNQSVPPSASPSLGRDFWYNIKKQQRGIKKTPVKKKKKKRLPWHFCKRHFKDPLPQPKWFCDRGYCSVTLWINPSYKNIIIKWCNCSKSFENTKSSFINHNEPFLQITVENIFEVSGCERREYANLTVHMVIRGRDISLVDSIHLIYKQPFTTIPSESWTMSLFKTCITARRCFAFTPVLLEQWWKQYALWKTLSLGCICF